MKKTFLLLSYFALLSSGAFAQDTIPVKPLKKVLELVVPSGPEKILCGHGG